MRDYWRSCWPGRRTRWTRRRQSGRRGSPLPCPADPRSGRRRRAARRSRREAPGPKRRPGMGKTGSKQSGRGQSRSGETGAVLESRERAEQPEGPAGLRTVLSDRPLEGDEASTLSWLLWAGPAGACRPSGAESGETRGGGRDCAGDPGGGTRLPLGDQRGWRAPDGSRPPWNWPGGQRGTAGSPEQTGRGRSPFGQDRMSRFSGSMTPARTVDRIFRRDARRYDGGFALF